MALNEAQIAHFYREGYVLVPGLVPISAVEAILEAAPKDIATDDRWRARIFEHAEPEKDAALHRLLVEPSVTEAVRAIFAASPRVYYGMVAVVRARGGQGLPWHQDNQYTPLLGGALNVFIALSEITPEKAILWVAPRSHLGGIQPSQPNETTAPGHREAVVAPENGIPLPTMQPGDVCIFDRCTYHRSLQNDTDEDRYAYAAQYVSESAREARTGEKNPKWILASDLRELWRQRGLIMD
jgi:ectoine hydroxylase-related dioxygenase (phytanoyl-CoA dioxygenase family)